MGGKSSEKYTRYTVAKTLKDKNLLIVMMYQQWELCDNTFTEWSAANKITLPAKIPCAQWLPSTCTLTKYDNLETTFCV